MSARRKFCSGGGGGTQKRLPINTKKGLPHAEKLAKNILLKYSYKFASEKVLRKCDPKRTKLHNNRRAKLDQIQGGGCRGPSKIRQRGGVAIFFYFLRVKNKTF